LVPLALVSWSPTAQMLVGETAATASRPVLMVGTGATVQDVPSQCSMSAVTPADLPTAQTLLLASATTPLRLPRPVPPGLGPVGIGTEVQVVPSQCSASGNFGSWFCAPAMPPTAQASLADTAVTAFSVWLRNRTTGVGVFVHVVPFQCRARPTPA